MKRAKKEPKASGNLLIQRARKNDQRALAQLLSLAESDLDLALKLLKKFEGKMSRSLRIGITGPPGAGKSTLLSHIVGILRSKSKRVGVILVDPSSPFSGGAILGDRVRMGNLSEDKNVFIRSVGSRGGLGGLSTATGVMAQILEICGFDLILIETVGVGQTELEIMNLADAVAVVVVPESGDAIQTLKAGILEIADTFVVNKSDRPGADIMAHELRALVELEPLPENSKIKKVLQTSATGGVGVEPLVEELLLRAETNHNDNSILLRRRRGELRHYLLHAFEKKLSKTLSGSELKGDLATLYLRFKKNLSL